VVRLPGHHPIEALFGKGAHWRRCPYDAHPADCEPGGGGSPTGGSAGPAARSTRPPWGRRSTTPR
jgi:hypothetical protein